MFRWDGQRMHVWTSATRFQALSEVHGHVYTAQTGIGLEEIVGDRLQPFAGGQAVPSSRPLFLYPWDNGQIFRDPSTGSQQLLAATTLGVMKVEGDTVSPTLPGRMVLRMPLPISSNRKNIRIVSTPAMRMAFHRCAGSVANGSTKAT